MQIENSKMIYRGSGELARVYRGQTIVWEPYEETAEDRKYLTLEVMNITSAPDYNGVTTIVRGTGELTFSYTGTVPYLDIYFSKNNGEWISYNAATSEQKTMTIGDVVRIKGNNDAYCFENSSVTGHYNLSIPNTFFKISGNILSLKYGDNFVGKRGKLSEYAFRALFEYTKGYARDAENLRIPSTGEHAFESLFFYQKFLTVPPSILPSTTLSDSCYRGMFYNCRLLQTVPELPARNLSPYCYHQMFQQCYSITRSPDLNAATLPIGAYGDMFWGCKNLQYIKCLATNNPTSGTGSWVYHVASTGTFVKHPDATWEYGDNGVPSGWPIVDSD